jgi:hypothetical protein
LPRNRWTILPIVVGQLAILLLGCRSESTSDRPDITVRDSGGITIVENAERAWNDRSAWRLARDPALSIGSGIGGDSALQFANIQGVHRLRSGGIAVLDAWAPAVVFFDASGSHVGRVGRRGTGPGEFPSRSVRGSFTCGTDSVYVVLGQNIAVYVGPGEYVRTFALDQPANVRTCSSGMLFAETQYGAWRSSAGTFTDSTVLVAFNLDGSRRSVVDTLPRQVSNWILGPEGHGYSLAPFSPTLSTTARGTLLATGLGDRFEIGIRDPSGAVKRMFRVLGMERVVGRSDIDAFLHYVFNPWRGNDDERRHIEQNVSAAEGQPLPAFAELRFDADGNLWARAFDHPDAVAFYDYSRFVPGIERPVIAQPRRWVVLDPDGLYLGVVETPPGFTVYEIGADHILGVWRDELDIQYIREYALIKPGQQTPEIQHGFTSDTLIR